MNAAGYARYSTDRQRHSSIIAQQNAIMAYCLAREIDLVASYTDEGYTGTNEHRAGFQALLRDARAHKFDAVVVYDISRGSRDVVDWFSFRKAMRDLKIAVLSVTENLGDIRDPSAFLTELITVGIGQHQVMQSREKSIAGKRVRAEQGKFCGGIPPLGYDVDTKTGAYVINPPEAKAVRMIFDLYAAGYSYKHIMEQLEGMGIVGKRGQKIGTNTLYYILKNERYTGKYAWFETIMRDMHHWVGERNPNPVIKDGAVPQIVPHDTWERVKRRMDDNKVNKMNKGGKRTYLLSGLLHCSKCGSAMVGVTTTAKGREYKKYICGNKKRLKNCDAKDIRAQEIEDILKGVLTRNLLNNGLIELTAEAIMRSAREFIGSDAQEIRDEIGRIDFWTNNLLASVRFGDLLEPVRDQIAENTARKQILIERLGDADVLELPSLDELIDELSVDAKRILDEPECMRELLNKYIVRVDINDREIVVHAVADMMLHRHPLYLMDSQGRTKILATASDGSCNQDWLPR